MSKRVMIIGGGVVGLSTAYFCSLRGMQVTVVERHSAGTEGCSYGNAGLIVPSHVVPLASPGMVRLAVKYMLDPSGPFYLKPRANLDFLSWTWKFLRSARSAHVRRAAPLIRDLNLASRDCFNRLAAACGDDFAMRKSGVINLCRTSQGLDHEIAAARLAESVGLPAEIVDANRARELLGIQSANIVGGVNYPDDCFLSPNRFMSALKDLVEKSGVRCEWESQVLGWRTEGPRILAVRTPHGDQTADEYVICAGSWSSVLAKGLRIHIPIEAGKGYSLTLPSPSRLPAIAAILSEARVAVTPMGESLRFGGTMEFAGLDERFAMHRVRRIIAAACAHFPDITPSDFDGIAPWQGFRPITPDGLPYLGRARHYDNLTVAAGHAMMGFSLGPITGQLVAEIMSGQPPSIALDLLAPDRFA